LGKPQIEVATKFIEFRKALESESFAKEDERVQVLLTSPYFFRKLTISILLAATKTQAGAKLEHALANINLLLPEIWPALRDTEKWQIGHTYAEVYSAGRRSAILSLREALLKVGGFDFVPENLRSDTFVKAAAAVLEAHEGMNNFYNEVSPMRTLARLGSTIPAPAFAQCASAIVAVRLGNMYGTSHAAVPIADRLLDKFSPERWQYFLNQCLPGDVRVLRKLQSDKPRKNWSLLVGKYKLGELALKNKDVSRLVSNTVKQNTAGILAAVNALLAAYYGKAAEAA
jgi:hypothetical protein